MATMHNFHQPPDRSSGRPQLQLLRMPQPEMLSHENQTRLVKLVREYGLLMRGLHLMVLDRQGNELASWSRLVDLDQASLAALISGDVSSGQAIAQLFGRNSRTTHIMIQEYDDKRVLLSAIRADLILFVATDNEAPLGWSRLQFQRFADRVLALLAKTNEQASPVSLVREVGIPAPLSLIAEPKREEVSKFDEATRLALLDEIANLNELPN